MGIWNFEMMTFLSDISETFSTLQGPIDLKPLLNSWHPADVGMPQIVTFSSQTCSKCLETLARVK